MPAHFELTADQWAKVVNCAEHCFSVKRSAPPVAQACHAHSAPLIQFHKLLRHASISDQQYFQAATIRSAITAAYLIVGKIDYVYCHGFL